MGAIISKLSRLQPKSAASHVASCAHGKNVFLFLHSKAGEKQGAGVLYDLERRDVISLPFFFHSN